MTSPRTGRRLLSLVAIASGAVAALVSLVGLLEPTRARPPTTPSPLPPEAFRPLPMPTATVPPVVTLPPPAGRLDDGGPEPTPPAVPTVPTPRPSAPAGPVHIVRPGDTLWQIAAWHRADLAGILTWNPGIDPRRLVSGQRILVPGGAAMPPKVERPATGRRTTPAPPATSGRHLWPLPIRGTITTRFSADHPGIDIAAPAGTPVRAIAGGTVEWAGWRANGGGYVVVIRHRDGMISTYNHNREVVVRVGQEVAAGQQIASVGATGRATGPHLDLRVEMDGRLVDPLSLY